MLVDHKFLYPVHTPASPPPVMGNAVGNPRFRRTPTQWWAPVGAVGVVTMDAQSPYTGDTYLLDVSAALSEDRKTLAIAVLNPSESEQSIKIAVNGTKLTSAGTLWRMAPDSIDDSVQVDKKPEVKVEEQLLSALPNVVTVRPFSVNIYSYPLQ
jgi:alpha-L-arabinofuranosidase